MDKLWHNCTCKCRHKNYRNLFVFLQITLFKLSLGSRAIACLFHHKPDRCGAAIVTFPGPHILVNFRLNIYVHIFNFILLKNPYNVLQCQYHRNTFLLSFDTLKIRKILAEMENLVFLLWNKVICLVDFNKNEKFKIVIVYSRKAHYLDSNQFSPQSSGFSVHLPHSGITSNFTFQLDRVMLLIPFNWKLLNITVHCFTTLA